jgi:hypothetical protein
VLSIPYKKNTKPLLTVQEKNNIIIVFLILPNKKYINTQKTKITQNGLKRTQTTKNTKTKRQKQKPTTTTTTTTTTTKTYLHIHPLQ